jgi:hypothetical protein
MGPQLSLRTATAWCADSPRSSTGPWNTSSPLIDTSALARLLRGDAEQYGWDQAAAAGLIATCPITELEFFYGARCAADRTQGIEDLRLLFGWVCRSTTAPGRSRKCSHSADSTAAPGPSTSWWPPRPGCRG